MCDARGRPARSACGPTAGFYSRLVIKACRDHKVSYSITAPQNTSVKMAIEAIDEAAWIPIDYTDAGEAWVAETGYGDGHRLVVRRTKLADPQPALFPTFRYHAFVTDRVGDAVLLDADHRRHAVVELAIRDLKEGSGLSHCPSGRFGANGAWAVCATIAHNLIRWLGSLGLEIHGPLVSKTIRRRFFSLPGRMTRWCTTALAPFADELALGRAVDCLLRSPLRTANLNQPPPRSLVACPAISNTRTIGDRRDEHVPDSDTGPHAVVTPPQLRNSGPSSHLTGV